MSVTTNGGSGRDLVQALDAIGPAIQAALPEHVSYERFRRVVLTAIQSSKELLAAERRALLTACLRAAQDGLMPDGREGAIVLFKGRPQWMPMVGGIMKLARNSGELASLSAHVVYEGEPFRVLLGDVDRIEHERVLEAVDAGKPRAVYARAVLRDGTVMHEAMTWKQVMKVKGASASGDKGPWGAWPEEMARKTVIRRLAKRLPLSTDRDGDARLRQAVERVDEDHGRLAAPVPSAAASLLADETGGRLDMLEHALDAPEPVPAEIENALPEQLAALATHDFPGDR
jgi:recombination protein RecT